MNIRLVEIEPDPIELDPRPCDNCGLTIDRHEMADDGEGPEFYCIPPDEMNTDELERRAELIRQVEVAAILARMDAMDGPADIPPPREPASYHPAQSTVDAFRIVTATGDIGRLKAWLADRPKDAPLLLALLGSPASC